MTNEERRIAETIIREYPEVANAVRQVLNERDLDEILDRAATRREMPMELRSVPGVVVRRKHEGDL